MKRILEHSAEYYRSWEYKNLAFLGLSLVLLWHALRLPQVQVGISQLGQLGYLGALLAGALFVSTFTVAPAGVAFYYLAQTLDPYLLALAGGAGAAVGDYLIFRFFRDGVWRELKLIFRRRLGGFYPFRIIRSPLFAWFAPVFGALIVASPLPDEVGLGLLGLSEIKTWKLLALVYCLNTAGIFAVVTLAQALS